MANIFRKNVLKNNNTTRTQASQLTLRQSIYPLVLVTILFFLWGFSYGLLDTLNKHFQNVLGITRARSAGLQAAYFGAYPLASLGHANWLLRHYGFKVVFIWGLCLYAVGALIAWPCLLYKSFGGFCAAIFIIGNGLGSLETAANPYITVCGPPKYSEMRFWVSPWIAVLFFANGFCFAPAGINLSQAFNGIGTVIAPVLGSYVFFDNIGDDVGSLRTVQWVYLAMACFTFLLAIVFYFSPIPEITDADMEFQAEESQTHPSAAKPFRKQYRLFHASFAQFCYTGSQVAIATFFINYVKDTRPGTTDSTAARFLSGAQAAFAIGRFAGVGIMKFVRPRWVFLGYMTMCIVFLAPTITQRGNTGMSMLYITLFFESIIFPTIVALGMRGLGKHSKRGSGFIIAGVSGGAVVSPAMGAAADARDRMGQAGTAIAMAVPLGFFLVPLSYAFCVNFVPAYREVIDRTFESQVGLQGSPTEDEESGSGGETGFGEGKGDVSHTENRSHDIDEVRKM